MMDLDASTRDWTDDNYYIYARPGMPHGGWREPHQPKEWALRGKVASICFGEKNERRIRSIKIKMKTTAEVCVWV